MDGEPKKITANNVMKPLMRSLGLLLSLPALSHAASFVIPADFSGITLGTGTDNGLTPSGTPWSTVATGASLPIRSSGTQNGARGAVAYYDVNTGRLSIDPKGWNLSLFVFTRTTGTVNTSGSTRGPLTYASGTSPTSATVSSATGTANQRTLPAGTWTLITVAPARIAGTVSLVRTPTLATTYDPGNGAAAATGTYTTNPVGEAITAGWFTQPWSFPEGMVSETYTDQFNVAQTMFYPNGGAPTDLTANWKVFGVSGNANANVLGFGNYRSTFQYTVDGVVGNQVGAVIPYSTVPEPAAFATLALGAIGFCVRRRRSN